MPYCSPCTCVLLSRRSPIRHISTIATRSLSSTPRARFVYSRNPPPQKSLPSNRCNPTFLIDYPNWASNGVLHPPCFSSHVYCHTLAYTRYFISSTESYKCLSLPAAEIQSQSKFQRLCPVFGTYNRVYHTFNNRFHLLIVNCLPTVETITLCPSTRSVRMRLHEKLYPHYYSAFSHKNSSLVPKIYTKHLPHTAMLQSIYACLNQTI